MKTEREQEIAVMPAPEHSTLVEHLAAKLGGSASAKAVFADPIERDGVTIIPVAKVRYGFGGGGGRKEHEEGSGGGGGVQASPLGYIEIKEGRSEFKPIRDPEVIVPIIVAGGFVSLLILRRILSIFRKENDKMRKHRS